MAKYIKTRSNAKNIKVLDKSANLSKRMKDNLIRTKEKAEETQNPRHASPTEYASDNIQHTARDAKTAAKDAKNTLREVRQARRQTLREVKQSARLETPKIEAGNTNISLKVNALFSFPQAKKPAKRHKSNPKQRGA